MEDLGYLAIPKSANKLSKLKGNSVQVLSAKDLIKEMKENTSSVELKYHSAKRADKGTDFEYIFSRHNAVGKSSTEKSIAQFLDTEAIFQINLKVVMEDYLITF